MERLLEEYHLAIYYAPGPPTRPPPAYAFLKDKVCEWFRMDDLAFVRGLRQVTLVAA